MFTVSGLSVFCPPPQGRGVAVQQCRSADLGIGPRGVRYCVTMQSGGGSIPKVAGKILLGAHMALLEVGIGIAGQPYPLAEYSSS